MFTIDKRNVDFFIYLVVISVCFEIFGYLTLNGTAANKIKNK